MAKSKQSNASMAPLALSLCLLLSFFFFFQYETKTSIRLSLTPLEEYNQSLDEDMNYDLTVPFKNSFTIYEVCIIIQAIEPTSCCKI